MKMIINLATLSIIASVVSAFQLNGLVKTYDKTVKEAYVNVYVVKFNNAIRVGHAKTDLFGHFTAKVNEFEIAENDTMYAITEKGSGFLNKTHPVPNGANLITAWTHSPSVKHITINELTTVATTSALAQFWNVKKQHYQGIPLFVKVAVSGVENLVNISTGYTGYVLSRYENGRMTTNLARFNSLANVVSGCVSGVKFLPGDGYKMNIINACNILFELAVDGRSVVDSLSHIARNPWRHVILLYELEEFIVKKLQSYYQPRMRFYAPQEWSIGIKYTGGGINSPGGIDFDRHGNLWSNNNFLLGSQSTLFNAVPSHGASKLDASGKALSPEVAGFVGGGIDAAGFGIAVAPDDSVWISNWGGKSISHLSKDGKALSPEKTGYNMNGTLGSLQSIVSDAKGNLWVADTTNSQIVFIPNGDGNKAEIVCRNETSRVGNECIVEHPFGLAIDKEGSLWISSLNGTFSYTFRNSEKQGSFVTKVNTSNYENFTMDKLGANSRGIAIDSTGHAWVASWGGRGIFLYAPNGTLIDQFHDLKYMNGPWGIAVDGNDMVWVADFSGSSIHHVCGTNVQHCPMGRKRTGAFIGKPFQVPGIQKLTDINIDMSGSVYGADNWNKAVICAIGSKEETVSTLCAGDGVVRLFGIAAPVRTPLALQFEPILV